MRLDPDAVALTRRNARIVGLHICESAPVGWQEARFPDATGLTPTPATRVAKMDYLGCRFRRERENLNEQALPVSRGQASQRGPAGQPAGPGPRRSRLVLKPTVVKEESVTFESILLLSF